MAGKLQQTYQDFDPSKIINTTDLHSAHIESLSGRIKDLESKIGTSEAFADTLCCASERAKKMHDWLAASVGKLIISDEVIKENLTKLVNQVDRRAFFVILKRFGWFAWTITVFVLTLSGKSFFDYLFHKLP